ncbi:S1 family peptidase [Actinophytocola sediminis]
MRRILAIVVLVLTALLSLPATGYAKAAAEPLGGGTVLAYPFGAGGQCTAAFAAVDARGVGHLVTEASCATLPADQLYAVNSTGAIVLVGTVVAEHPAYAIVLVTNTVDWELVPWIATGLGQIVIAGSQETPVGDPVCLVDRPIAFPCGTVVATDDPVGPIKGLTRTDLCASAEAVAYVTRDQAQGVPASESSFCTTAGTSWFAPINPILNAEGLRLLTG